MGSDSNQMEKEKRWNTIYFTYFNGLKETYDRSSLTQKAEILSELENLALKYAPQQLQKEMSD
jgi:hypothetical protein